MNLQNSVKLPKILHGFSQVQNSPVPAVTPADVRKSEQDFRHICGETVCVDGEVQSDLLFEKTELGRRSVIYLGGSYASTLIGIGWIGRRSRCVRHLVNQSDFVASSNNGSSCSVCGAAHDSSRDQYFLLGFGS